MNTPYLTGYSEKITDQIQELIQKDKLGELIIKKYPAVHELRTDKALYTYTLNMKNEWLRQSSPLSKVAIISGNAAFLAPET